MGFKPSKGRGEPVRSRAVKSRGVRSRGSKRETGPKDREGLESGVERRGATPLRLPNSEITEPRAGLASRDWTHPRLSASFKLPRNAGVRGLPVLLRED